MGSPVLLVHDDIATIAAIRRLLAREGHEMVLATSAADALIAFGHHLPSLVILAPAVEGNRGKVVVEELASHPDAKLARLLLLGQPIPGVAAKVVPLPLDGSMFLQMVTEVSRSTSDVALWQVQAMAAAQESPPPEVGVPQGFEEWRTMAPPEAQSEVPPDSEFEGEPTPAEQNWELEAMTASEREKHLASRERARAAEAVAVERTHREVEVEAIRSLDSSLQATQVVAVEELSPPAVLAEETVPAGAFSAQVYGGLEGVPPETGQELYGAGEAPTDPSTAYEEQAAEGVYSSELYSNAGVAEESTLAAGGYEVSPPGWHEGVDQAALAREQQYAAEIERLEAEKRFQEEELLAREAAISDVQQRWAEEERARREVEEALLREQQAREEADRKLREVEEAAAREAAERLRQSRELAERQQAEERARNEARLQAERVKEVGAHLEEEARLRQEAERRARAEKEERGRKEKELLERLREEEAARIEAQRYAEEIAREKEDREKDLQARRRAEEEARREAEAALRREARAREATERKAREEVARLTAEKARAEEEREELAKRVAGEQAAARELQVRADELEERGRQTEAARQEAVAAADEAKGEATLLADRLRQESELTQQALQRGQEVEESAERMRLEAETLSRELAAVQGEAKAFEAQAEVARTRADEERVRREEEERGRREAEEQAQLAREEAERLHEKLMVPLAAPDRTTLSVPAVGTYGREELARLFWKLCLGKVSVLLELKSQDVLRVLWLERGTLVGASSSLPHEGLLARARRDGLIDGRQESELRLLRGVSTPELLKVLVDRAYLRAAETAPLLARFIEQVALEALSEAETVFRLVEEPVGTQAPPTVLPRPALQVLIEALKRTYGAEKLLQDFGGLAALVLPLHWGPGLDLLGFSDRERRFLEAADGEKTLEELLLVSGLHQESGLKVLGVGRCLGLLKVAPPEAPPATHPSPELDLRRLEAKYAEIQDADYFTILGIPRSAGGDEVERAFHHLAREFHPIKYAGHPDPSLQRRAQTIQEAIAEAALVLQDDRKRADYARHLVD